MLKKLGMMLAVILLAVGLVTLAVAADKLKSKVTKIESDKVTVVMEGDLPAWVKPGATVTAGGGAPKVLAVNGKEVVLRFSRSKAAKIKVDSTMSVSEFTGDELQGC
ncbi:MAG: selenite/tellurite reduction operon protein ExtJ [Syntrophales bacterium]